ncbi:hypothetical protein FSARC_328 [Fusarium sarcochroum]|uniref:Zn(2)-C6 fungal-type domain-containing protein n=1 Tax=Fusarium sarcochroum TaxID=1208366 RepID=A0A8H4UBH7_9HYPO|nr:hypothetical protein FSARC_328 [Fusarium sarcochroum]
MRTQACEPCAKRKVRCDRAEPPCSNCKRRKHDHCAYPDVSPFDRIKKLEETVRSLGGDPSPDQTERPRVSSIVANPGTSKSNAETPIIVQEEGRSIYHESEGWHTWIDVSRLYKGTKPQANPSAPHDSALSPGKYLPHAFQGSPWRDASSFPEALPACPIPTEEAVKLWDVFMERVEPVVKISFEWTLSQLKTALSDPEKWRGLDDGDHALILATCLFGAVSFTNQECVTRFDRSRSSLIAECRLHCDMAFSHINVLVIDSVSTLKAFCLYIKANVDLLTSRSLWSLVGLISRSAEQLGIQRDGTVLGLSPIDTEERRRLWWQLQHLDLILSLKSGVTPLSFAAGWDVKLPLNIEDCDLKPESQIMPKARPGLTSFSYTLFIYYIMEKQRSFRMNQSSQQGTRDKSLLGSLGDPMIDDLEKGLNENFLQYCDPIKPIDTLLQMTARAVVNVLRLRKLHEIRMRSERQEDECHIAHFNTCMQSLKYVVVSHSNPQLKRFTWLLEASFVWHAFIGVLVDMSNLKDVNMIKEAWSLLSQLYDVAGHLSDLGEDRRNAHAARSVVATWYECCQKPGLRTTEKPNFVSDLESRLSELESSTIRLDGTEKDGQAGDLPDIWQTRPGEDDFHPFGFEFADIDWAFWDSIS